MNIATIVADLLRSIPPRVRQAILAVFVILVVAVQVLKLFGVDLDYDAIEGTLLIIGGYLGVQSLANVDKLEPTPAEAEEEEEVVPDGGAD